MIRTIYIKDENPDRYTLKASTHVLGKTFDNNAEQIKVIFPAIEIEKSSACTMFVFADGEQIDSISVSNNVPFDITNVLSRHKEIEIGFRFTNSDDYVKNCDFDKFYFTEVKQPVPYTPATPEQESQINTLLGQAFVNVRWKSGTSNQIEFLNLSGGVQHTITIADATTTASGFMSATDKTKLDGIEAGAEVNAVNSVNAKTGDVVLISTDVSALPDTTKYGASIDLSIDSSTYVITAQLKDQDGNNIGSAKTIDLPIESVVVSGSYDSVNKKVILMLQNGSTIEFSVADLISGLVSDTTTIAGIRLNNNISASDLRTALNVENGASAFNEDNIIAGSNVTITKDGHNVTINSTDSGASSYADLPDKPSINSVTLSGNKTSSDLGLQPAGNYALSSEIPTKTSDLTNDSGFIDDTYHDATKQNVTDNSLTTTNKTIPAAINEVNSIAKGANQTLTYGNYATMITAFNALDSDVYNVGQNILIVTLEVPDLWISSIESTSVTYTYTTDSAFTTALATDGYVQVGYYKLSALETQKVDLTNYVQYTDTPSLQKAGPVRVSGDYGVGHSNGLLTIINANTTLINAKSNVYRPITPSVLDYAVKVGVTTNTNTLTDVEKANAQTWLGIKSWRKIYDRTLAEAESGIDIVKDLDDNGFQITDFRCTVYIPADAGNTNSGYLRFKGDAEVSFGALYGSTNYGTTNNNCLNVYEGHIKAGQPFFLEFTENMAQATASRTNIMRSLSNTINYYTYLSGIQLYRNSGNFPIGTRVVCYGIDK